ncbi:MAG: hypothetical protein R2792_06230 [Saprospiraceae bacterium]
MKRVFFTILLLLLWSFTFSQNYIEIFIQQYELMKPKDQEKVDKYINYFLCQYSTKNWQVYKNPNEARVKDNGYTEIAQNLTSIKKKYKIENSFVIDYLLAINISYKGRDPYYYSDLYDVSKNTRFQDDKEVFDYLNDKYDLIENYINYPLSFETFTNHKNRTHSLLAAYYLNRVQLEFVKRGNFTLIKNGFDLKKLEKENKVISEIYDNCGCYSDNKRWVNNVAQQVRDKRNGMLNGNYQKAKEALTQSQLQNIIVSDLNASEIKGRIDEVFKIEALNKYIQVYKYFDNDKNNKVRVENDMYLRIYESEKDFITDQLNLESLPKKKSSRLGYFVNFNNLVSFQLKPSNCTFIKEEYAGDLEFTSSITTKTKVHYFNYVYDCECDINKILFVQELVSKKVEMPLEDYVRSDSVKTNEMVVILEVKGETRVMEWAKNLGKALASAQGTDGPSKASGYEIFINEGNHSIRKDKESSAFVINIIDGGIFSSNVDKDSYLVTYKSGSQSWSTSDPFNDSLSDVANRLTSASEIEVTINYKKYKGDSPKSFKAKIKEPGWYSINIY